MKPAIKKLKTCQFSKPMVADFFGKENAHTHRLTCDHPEKKIDWELAVCESCDVYVNRNKPAEPESPKKKTRGRKPAK
jgi:hypothetical protein